ncbi:polyketide synthase [Nocardia sp. NBC_01730]|uniref:beta-ketoacyl [acyl carrier protein] synthase domain-containing protein n=1 Tax=Nocardia sp. NBC_01730 TaxID=2975998 RepID=UPI002E0F39E1|nr:polyketide synthase [Nocardia sp. NBC_01730]
MEPDGDHIVVAGMGVEAPGGVDNTASLWRALTEKRELIGVFPRDRGWPLDRVGVSADGRFAVPDAGGFLRKATMSDPEYLGVTWAQARAAQRVSWQALENAQINPDSVAGEAGGCFMGTSYRTSATTIAEVPGWISNNLRLCGPSVSVDTACASGLSALHLAAAAIRNGECEWALAGAVSVMGEPSAFFESAKVDELATDGHCRSFADNASGTVWAEGAAAVVLERESRARRLGHPVYGRLLASQINHNSSYRQHIVPSAAQEQLIRRTIAHAGIAAEKVRLIEGHGGGTRAGDSVEVTALQNTYGLTDPARGGSLLGSVKSNLGHAQGAASMLGLIKLLLCGVNGQIAPSLFADTPTTEVDWEASSLRLASKLEPWPLNDGFRYGAVSSFGMTGTNAHAILAMPGTDPS